ncbi:MAG: GNAT family N-acetyltransferase [Elusimicrobiota bacterium]
MERIRERQNISGRNIVFREAGLPDAPLIRTLFETIYQGKYPLEFGTNVELMLAEIGDPAHHLWLVAEDEKERRLAGAMMFVFDPKNRMGKACGGVVLPEYRHYGLGSNMLKKGVRFLTKGPEPVDVIYGTSRTVSEGPSKMVAEAGFHKMGFFPNAVQIEELEHLNLDVYLTPKALKSRRRNPYLFTPFYDIYAIARRQLGLERAHLVNERGPLTLSKKKIVLNVVKDSKKTIELFRLYMEQKRISNSFFPFHKPNWLLSSEDGGTDVFIWYGGVGKQASILGFRTDRVNIHDLLDSVAGALQRSGASYVELLVDAYDYMSQREAYAAKYIPSAYFPAMRLASDGLRDDYFVVSRTFQIIDFTSSYVTPENLPYLKAYMRFYNDLYIEPMKRSNIRRKADD